MISLLLSALVGCSATSSKKLSQHGLPSAVDIRLKPLSVIGGVLGSSRLSSPSDLILDQFGNLYVLDSGNNRLVKLNGRGRFLKEVGGFGGGVNQFRQPAALAFDGGINILVADSENRRLVKYDRNLNYAGSVDTYLDVSQTERNFGLVGGVAFTRQSDILLSDLEEDRVLKLDSFYNMSGEFGGFGYGYGQLQDPGGIAIDSRDNVYVADSGNGRIAVFNPFGKFIRSIGEDELVTPRGVEIDEKEYVWVADAGRGEVLVFGKGGALIQSFGGEKISEVKFSYPVSLRVLPGGRLWVLEGRAGELKIFEVVR